MKCVSNAGGLEKTTTWIWLGDEKGQLGINYRLLYCMEQIFHLLMFGRKFHKYTCATYMCIVVVKHTRSVALIQPAVGSARVCISSHFCNVYVC